MIFLQSSRKLEIVAEILLEKIQINKNLESKQANNASPKNKLIEKWQ